MKGTQRLTTLMSEGWVDDLNGVTMVPRPRWRLGEPVGMDVKSV